MSEQEKLRTELIKPFCDYFKVSDLVAIKNLLRIHSAGYEFQSVSDFVYWLRSRWPSPHEDEE